MNKRWTIGRRLVIALLSLSLLPIGLMGYLALNNVQRMGNLSIEDLEKAGSLAAKESAKALEDQAKESLMQLAKDKSETVNLALSKIQNHTYYAARVAASLFDNKQAYRVKWNPSRYVFDARGVLGAIEPSDHKDRSQVWVNNRTPLTDNIKETLAISEHLDVMYKAIKERHPDTAWIYTTFENGVDRTYPWFSNDNIAMASWDPRSRAYYTGATQVNNPLKEAVWVTPYQDAAGRGWIVTCSVPLYSKAGRFLGVQANDITLDSLVNSVLSIKIKKTGYAFLLSKDGHTIAFPSRADKDLRWEGTKNQASFNLLETPHRKFIGLVQEMVSGKSGMGSVILSNTVKYVAYAPIKTTGWSMGVVVPRDEIVQPVIATTKRIGGYIEALGNDRDTATRTMVNHIVLGMILTAIAASFTAMLLARRITRPIAQLVKGANLIGSGDLSYRIPIERDDEVGDLARSFHAMEEKLKSSYESLEEKIKDLAIANKRLEQATRAKSEFLANMSHELRTPLNSIIGFSEVLLERMVGELNEDQTMCAGNINTSGKHLLGLINEILDLSKVEAGRVELVLEEFSLPDALSECLTLVNTLAMKKGIALESSVQEDVPTITADPTRFKQILYNLLSNAIKFTPDKGRVGIEARIKDGMVEIAVTDTGIGIEKDKQEKIFEEFYQVDNVYTRQHQGTGLGLSLTKKLVELHGGRIWVESEPGQGSRFRFTVPLHPKEAPKVMEVAKEGPVKPLILVVEDEKQAGDLLTLYLEQEGYGVARAFDGVEAIEKAKALKPSAITLDVFLPKKDGLQVLRELKGLPETQGIPVIVISIVDNKELGFSLGATDYLVKPIRREELIKRLKSCGVRPRPGGGSSILVVDDNPQDVALLGAILEPEGYRVIKAYGGKEGIDLAISENPDAIILDLLMPEVNGFEVAEALRAHPRAKDIPIFIYTAKELTKEDQARLDDYVVSVKAKGGCSKEELLSDIRKAIKERVHHGKEEGAGG